jgi:hypothetical protein
MTMFKSALMLIAIGGAAAPALADRWDGYGYARPDQSYVQVAIDQCRHAAYNDAARYGRVQPGPIGDVDRIGGGYKVKGDVAVSDPYRGYYHDGGGYRRGSFSCEFRGGQITKLKLHGF